MSTLQIAVCQMQVQKDPQTNLEHAAQLVHEAAQHQAEVVVLPEMFLIPYSLKAMKHYAVPLQSDIRDFLSSLAKQENILLIAGSIPEKGENGNFYNTNLTFSPQGELLTQYQKIHLFDVNMNHRVSFQESAVLSPGNQLRLIHYKDWVLSTVICYDARFPELFRLLVDAGAQAIFIPASFSKATGEMHWDLTMRCRAVDHQIFIAAASTARNPENAFQPWGYSMIVDPWGKVLAQAQTDEKILYADLDSTLLPEVRQELPLLKHRRTDLYEIVPHLPIQQVFCDSSILK